ncbi:bifunctional glutamate N-acetyltransferase/amino-acid acetyltransferase ArgJ [Pseudomonadota bacterium]
MAVGLSSKLPSLLPVSGVRWGVAQAGIKYPDRYDVALMEIADGAMTAGVYTRNAFCAAPVVVAKRHGASAPSRYLLINSGNANAGTGLPGMRAAEDSCEAAASLMGCDSQSVLPFSTGVIGELLPVAKIAAALPAARESLSESGWVDAANAIMTTDTVPKGVSRQLTLAGEVVTITGIAKGSGMIRPDMATMLAYVATDAAVAPELLQQLLKEASDKSFNAVTVDGDTSTNDACVLVATGRTGVGFSSCADAGFDKFSAAITDVCQVLAQAMIRDGEGASKFVTIEVCDGESEAECRQVAYTVAHSPLVKTALFASDPNWGRILAAVGRAGVESLDVSKVDLYLGDVRIVQNGGLDPRYTEEAGQAVMDQDEILIRVCLSRGAAEAVVWTTDLSYEYVKINAEYRS